MAIKAIKVFLMRRILVCKRSNLLIVQTFIFKFINCKTQSRDFKNGFIKIEKQEWTTRNLRDLWFHEDKWCRKDAHGAL